MNYAGMIDLRRIGTPIMKLHGYLWIVVEIRSCRTSVNAADAIAKCEAQQSLALLDSYLEYQFAATTPLHPS